MEDFFNFFGLFTISEVYDCNHSTAKKIITIMMMITISNIQTTFTELCIESELFSHYTLQGRRNLGTGSPPRFRQISCPMPTGGDRLRPPSLPITSPSPHPPSLDFKTFLRPCYVFIYSIIVACVQSIRILTKEF